MRLRPLFLFLTSIFLFLISVKAILIGNDAFYIKANLYKDDFLGVGVKYTPSCLLECHLPFYFKYSGRLAPPTIVIEKDDLGKFLKHKLNFARGNLKYLRKIEVRVLRNVTYNQTVWIPNIICVNETIRNETGTYNLTKCVDNGYWVNETRWKWVWKNLRDFDKIVLKKDEWYFIDICGEFKKPGFRVDVVPTLNILNKEYEFSEWSWWNSTWRYRRPITITEQSGNNLTDYQIAMNISVAGWTNKPLSDFSDIRFTYYNSTSDEETKIPYWIEDYVANSWVKVWVKVTYIPANDNATIYMYYGNTSVVESESNPNEVFDFYDSFETYNLGDLKGQDGWYTVNYGNSYASGTIDVQNSEVFHGSQAVQGNSVHTEMVCKDINLELTKFILKYKFKFEKTGNTVAVVLKDSNGKWVGVGVNPPGTGSDQRPVYATGSDSWAAFGSNIAYPSNWFDVIIKFDTNSYDYIEVNGQTTSATLSYSISDIKSFCLADRGAAAWGRWDIATIRKYTDPEPSYEIGEEEVSGFIPPTITIYSPLSKKYVFYWGENPVIHINFTVSGNSSTFDVKVYEDGIQIFSDENYANNTNTVLYRTYSTGEHNVTIWANDTTHNTQKTKTVIFSVFDLNDFQFRRAINITEQSGNTLTQYPVAMNISVSNWTNKPLSDFSDIRFTYYNSTSDEETKIPYWIEDYVANSWVKVWVKVTYIPANDNATIYMYYGNTSVVESESNPNEVCPGGLHDDIEGNEKCWIFYEDFSTDVFSQPEWTRSSSSKVYVENGELKIPNIGTYDDWAEYDTGNCIVYFSNSMELAVEQRTYSDDAGGENYETGAHYFLNATGYLYDMYHNLPDNKWGWKIYNNWGPPKNDHTADGWLLVRGIFNSTHESFYYSGGVNNVDLHLVRTEKNPYGISETCIRGLKWRQSWDINMRIDWVGIRKFADPEPTYEIGEEETANQPPLVETPKTYDENLVEKTSFSGGEKVVIRVNVTDPQGAEDIDKVLITIINPNNVVKISNQTMVNISSIPNGYTYEYNFTITEAYPGDWTINIYANDTSNLWDSNTATFTESNNIIDCVKIEKGYETYYLTKDIVDSSSTKCMDISANNIVFNCQNYTIDGIDGTNTYGIQISRASQEVTDIKIVNCTVSDWQYGIFIKNGNSNTINISTLTSNSYGIFIKNGNSNTINISTLTSNSVGIYIWYSDQNLISRTKAISNVNDGIYILRSESTTIENSTIENNKWGISVASLSNFTTIKFSNITKNSYGITIQGFTSYSLLIHSNRIESNTNYGIEPLALADSQIYNNLFNNTNNVRTDVLSYANDWNVTKQTGDNIWNKSLGYIGGNAWFKPDGTGFSETCGDNDFDGFCDNPYTLATDNTDYLPIAKEVGQYTDTIPPTITFVSQTPSNINESTIEPVTIIINITDDSGVDLSKVAFFTGINHTLTPEFCHYNWSWRYPANDLQPDMRRADNRNMSYWFESIVFKESPDDIWTFAGYDNTTYEFEVIDSGDTYYTINITFFSAQMMFPQIFPFDKMYLTAEDKTGQYIELHKNNWIKIKFYPKVFYNYTTENYTIYIDLNVDPSFTPNTKPLEIYFCNSSYTTGDPLDSDYCVYVEDIDATDTRTIVINQSSYIQNIFYIKDGYIDGVKVSDEAYLVLRTTVPAPKAFRLYYADDEINEFINFSNFNHAWLSSDDGSTWNPISYTPDFYFISTQAERDKIMYYVYACDVYDNCANSSMQYDSLDPVNHPPAEPLIIAPTENENVTGLYNITWLTIGDPDFDLYNASVYLCNPDGSINVTLVDNNITGNNSVYEYHFEFNASEFPNGKYRINVTLCDVHGLCSSSLTAYNFTIYHRTNVSLEQNISSSPALIKEMLFRKSFSVLPLVSNLVDREIFVARSISQSILNTIYLKVVRIPFIHTQFIKIAEEVGREILVFKSIIQSIKVDEIASREVEFIKKVIQSVLFNLQVSRWVSSIRELVKPISVDVIITKPSIIVKRYVIQTIVVSITNVGYRVATITQRIYLTFEIFRKQGVFTRYIPLKPIIDAILKVIPPVRVFYTLTSPPYPLFIWFANLENLVLICLFLVALTVISFSWIAKNRKKLWKRPEERY